MSSSISTELTFTQIVAAFTEIKIQTVIDYSISVHEVDTTLIKVTDLGFVVFNRAIIETSYTEISAVLQICWRNTFEGMSCVLFRMIRKLQLLYTAIHNGELFLKNLDFVMLS